MTTRKTAKKPTVKRARTPAQKAATAKMLAANRAKKKAIGKAKASNPSRSVKPARGKTVKVVSASKLFANDVAGKFAKAAGVKPGMASVEISDNGVNWKPVSVFQSAAMAKEYATALYEKHDGKKYVRVIG